MSLQTLDCGSKILLIVITSTCQIELRRSPKAETFVRFNASQVKVTTTPETIAIKSLKGKSHGSITQTNTGVMNGGMYASNGSTGANASADAITIWTDPEIEVNIVNSAGVDLLFFKSSMD